MAVQTSPLAAPVVSAGTAFQRGRRVRPSVATGVLIALIGLVAVLGPSVAGSL